MKFREVILLQIQIVSHQLLPNVIGFLLTKPSRILLLTTDNGAIIDRAMRLQAFYKSEFNIDADIFDVGKLGFYAHHLQQAREILASVKSKGFDISKLEINATGGSKPLADAFKQAVLEHQGTAFYCHTELKQLEYYNPPKFVSYNQVASINFEQLLNVQGYNLTSEQLNHPWREVVDALAELLIYQYDANTSQINAQLNKRTLKVNEHNLILSLADKGYEALNNASEALNSACNNLMFVDVPNKKVSFETAQFAKFLNGQWFEQWVYAQAKTANPHQLYISTVIEDENNTLLKQELDVVLMHNHQLLLIECKTSKSANIQPKEINRLVQLNRNLGTLTRVCFIALNGVNEEAEARLKRECIDYIVGDEVKNISTYFNNWVIQAEQAAEPFVTSTLHDLDKNNTGYIKMLGWYKNLRSKLYNWKK